VLRFPLAAFLNARKRFSQLHNRNQLLEGGLLFMGDSMVIFTRVFVLLDWLLPKSERFPRAQRLVTTQRLMSAALDMAEHLNAAQSHRGRARQLALTAADAELQNLRLYLRLIYHWQWLSAGQYRHVSELVAEIGKLLGGWLKQSRSQP